MGNPSRLSKLLSPVRIAGANFKNRIVMAPMVTQYGGSDGFITNREKDFFLRRAEGGAALITIGNVVVAEKSQMGPVYDGIWDDKFIPAWRNVAGLIHDCDAKLSLQLSHAGSRCFAKLTGGEPVAPSAFRSQLTGELARELAKEEIETLAEKWADAAWRAKEAGVDAVEVQGAQGFLVHNFMTPLVNKRDDEYGGDLKRRMRFPMQIVKKIKEKVGPTFPLIFRMVISDRVEGGITPKDAESMAVLLVAAGADALHVTAGAAIVAGEQWACAPPVDVGTGCIVDLVARLKKVVDVPVITVQRIIDPLHAEGILQDGKADMVALGRALICDPDWPRKAAEGKFADIRKCIGCCQGCLDRTRDGKVSCLHNPEAGKERDYEIHHAVQQKKVMVIGGGPAGLEVAKVAAHRKHEVLLYEAKDRLGGQWNLASAAPKKECFKEVIRYDVRELEALGVRIELGTTVDAALVEQVRPDVVIVATGAVPLIPNIPGIDRDQVVTAHDILSGTVQAKGNRVAVIGGGLVGCETADFVAEQGKDKKVTVIEMLDEIAADMGPSRRHFMMERLGKYGVEVLTSVRVEAITGQEVMGKKRDEPTKSLGTYDTVILALGVKSLNDIAEKIKEKVPEVYIIGDALSPRKAIDAIAEGADLGRKI